MKTNKKMMILSVFGIIFVVSGHTGTSINLMADFFPYYSFHMALFIFISGYFYKVEYENDIFKYIKKKIKKLLVPYFIWNLIYGIICAIMRHYNIIQFGKEISINTLLIEPWTTGHQFMFNLSAWFVPALFLVNVSYCLLRKILNKLKIWNDSVILIIFIILGMLSVKCCNTGYNITQNRDIVNTI